MTTLVVCIKRRHGMSAAEFSTYWRDVHAPLLGACTDFTRHLISYVQHHFVDRASPVAAMFGVSGDYDGVAVLTFRNAEALAQAFVEPRYLADIRPDEPNFVDLTSSLSFVTEPHVVISPPADLFSIAGKVAVVTGGAKGVGAMISTALVDAGARVLIVARGGTESEAFAAALAQRGSCTLLSHDLSTMDGVRAAAEAVQSHTDKVHILVNNAGTFTAAPIEALAADQWDREVALNLRAPFFLVQTLLPQLKAAAGAGDPARVINIGSIAALWAKSSMAYAYSATKGGVHQLTRALASDLTRQGITVNAIAPGFFPSDMTTGFFDAVPGLKEQMIEGIPAHRLGSPDDIGGTVIFLASRAGAYLSGAILPVEGGLWSA
ncbi:SDR family oxidoreductase [Novosphingobium lentum]|uniref:SDR family oxidoreductase n=1 Tax=Novosphingobium lentum TaxID=145287 RepID=UPI000A7DC696|nr:SDR family oxidoreductase [Novosphingobium lentum]